MNRYIAWSCSMERSPTGDWVRYEDAERLREQRDRAWRTLMAIEDNLGKLDDTGLAFLLAAGHGREDAAEWNALCEEIVAGLEQLKGEL